MIMASVCLLQDVRWGSIEKLLNVSLASTHALLVTQMYTAILAKRRIREISYCYMMEIAL